MDVEQSECRRAARWRSLQGEVRRADDTDCDIFWRERVRTVDGASARRDSRDGGGVWRHLRGWLDRHSVVAGLLRGRVCGLRHTYARHHRSNRRDRQHKRTAHGSARWRQLPDLDHVHDTARHHACMSDGSPSDRFDDVDGWFRSPHLCRASRSCRDRQTGRRGEV
jgi:hypothetical protein